MMKTRQVRDGDQLLAFIVFLGAQSLYALHKIDSACDRRHTTKARDATK